MAGDPFENLANAVVEKAVSDYRIARHKLKRCPKSAEALAMIKDCERFFLNEKYFGIFTNLDGRVLLEKLREETK